jgi:hypothetical protein
VDRALVCLIRTRLDIHLALLFVAFGAGGAAAIAVAGVLASPARAVVAGPQVQWAPVGSRPLGDTQAAALVTHRPENRPANVAANSYVPSDAQLAAFASARDNYGETPAQYNPLYRYVDGRPGLAHPSTDDLIQWTARKWGIPEDWLRAEMAVESWWNQSQLGDLRTVSSSDYLLYPASARVPGTSEVYVSMGVMQVSWRPDGTNDPGTDPLRWASTAFNLDYFAATVRYYYDGLCTWCGAGYGPGQTWASIGGWYNPSPWNNAGAQTYITKVKSYVTSKPWTRVGF